MSNSRGSWKRMLLLSIGSFIGALLTVNAPGILSGYGFIAYIVVLAILSLEPLTAGLVILVGGLLALPLQVASKSILAPVALLGLILRPLVAYLSGLVVKRYGGLPGVLSYAGLSSILALSAGILYYGNDGIHAGLAVFNLVPGLLAYSAFRAFQGGGRLMGAFSLIGGLLAISASLVYFDARVFVLGLAIAVLSSLSSKGGESRFYRVREGIAGVLLVLAILLALLSPLMEANMSVILYPVKPASYSGERWSACGMDNVFQGVHDPGRLRIVSSCVRVEGVVSGVPFMADDGDVCFDVKPVSNNPLYDSLGSIVLRHGMLHSEVIPLDRGLLSGLNDSICVGDRIVVEGPLVVDTDHGLWSEVHPVVNITLVERGKGPCIVFPVGS